MSLESDLPASCQGKWHVRNGSRVRISNIAKPGQTAGASLTWIVPVADIIDFCNVVSGLPETFVVFGQTVTRIVPLKHPVFSNLLATDVEAESRGLNDDGDNWSHYLVTVNFSSPDYSTTGDKPFVSENVDMNAKTIPLPAVASRIGGVAPVYDPGRTVRGVLYSLTTHQLPSLPVSTYTAYAGKTNNATFLGMSAGHVLYLGPSAQQQSVIGTSTTYSITHNFDLCSLNHNYGALPNGTFGERTFADGSLEFPQADLTLLFS